MRFPNPQGSGELHSGELYAELAKKKKKKKNLIATTFQSDITFMCCFILQYKNETDWLE